MPETTSPTTTMIKGPTTAQTIPDVSRKTSSSSSPQSTTTSSIPPSASASASNSPTQELDHPVALLSTSTKQQSSDQSNNGSASDNHSPPLHPQQQRRSSFGLNFLSGFSMRGASGSHQINNTNPSTTTSTDSANHLGLMSNSPTIANLNDYLHDEILHNNGEAAASAAVVTQNLEACQEEGENQTTPIQAQPSSSADQPLPINETTDIEAEASSAQPEATELSSDDKNNGMDKDGFYSVRLTPLIDHSSTSSGLYFSPIIRKIKPDSTISVGRYTEKNKAAAHAPQGSSAPIVFKSKVVSRTHALFQCNEDGQWFLKDCKSSSGTFLNHIRLSPASQESTLMPLIDGDIIQLGMDYRGGTEEVYRCVKMRCEFNKSWQRKVNQFNLEIHKKLKHLHLNDSAEAGVDGVTNKLRLGEELTECAICLMKIEPCQALFISPCSHSWHYKCIRPLITKSYPQFYCPNCRTMCDLETDLDEDD